MLILLLCAAMIVAWRWPQTPVGRVLHRLMVEWPARQLAKLDPGKLLPKLGSGRMLLVLLLVLAVGMAIEVARSDGMMFLAQVVPDGVAWFATFDIATYLDVVALGVVLGATVRLRAIYAALKAWVVRSVLGRKVRQARGARRRTPHPRRRPPPSSNDDEPAWADFGLAYG